MIDDAARANCSGPLSDGVSGDRPDTVPGDVAARLRSCADTLSRRGFVRLAGGVTLTALCGGLLVTFPGCEAGDRIFRGERTWTDDAGREMKIPTADKIESVYFTSALAQVYILTLNPDLMAGVSSKFTEADYKFLPESLRDLPQLGSMSGDGEIDIEALMAMGIQVVFSISGIEITAENISDADSLSTQTNIPVVLIDGSFDKTGNAYRELGDILGCTERAEEIAVYLEGIYEEVTQAVSQVAEEDKITLYYAEGPVGLQTDPDESQHAKAFSVAGAKNVAAVEETQGLGMTNVSMEQVLAWNPEVIVAWDDENRGGADERIRTNQDWSQIQAVKDGRVYTMPDSPFAWLDRPNGVNRFIGIQWIANMLYPSMYDVDMVERAQEFYQLMYNVDLSEDEAKTLLGNSYPPYGTS